MKTQDILDLLKAGKKPMVRLTNNLWDDSWGEKGMIARIVSFKEHRDDQVELMFDFNENKAHNLSLQSHGYYIWKDGQDTKKAGTAFEAGLLDENDIKEEVYFGTKNLGHGDDEVPVELVDSPILAEYAASGSKVSYVEWLEAKLEELVPDCMKTWKEGL